jgi:hypothetical protein
MRCYDKLLIWPIYIIYIVTGLAWVDATGNEHYPDVPDKGKNKQYLAGVRKTPSTFWTEEVLSAFTNIPQNINKVWIRKDQDRCGQK